MKGFRWKIITGILGVTLMVGGTVTVWNHYRDQEFQPAAYTQERQRKENQVIFPGEDNAIGDQSSDDSELWKQNDNSKENMKPEDRPSSSMLFQTIQVADTQPLDQEIQTKQPDSTEEQKDKVYTPGDNDQNGPKIPGHTVKDDDSSADNKDDNSNGEDGNTPGEDTNSANDTAEDNSSSNTNKPSDSDKPSNSDKPSKPDKPSDKPSDSDKPADKDPNTGRDVDTTVPTAPKDDAIIPADPYPGDDKINIKNDEEYKRYSLVIKDNLDSDEKTNGLYSGEYLNDLRVFYASKVYLCIDGKITYRLTDLNDNFKLGAYPEQVPDDVNEIRITYYYRPGAQYDWIECTDTIPVRYSAKLLLQSWTSGTYIDQVMVPKADHQVVLYRYYYQMMHPKESMSGLADANAITKLFNGWSETEDGVSVGPCYMAEGTGAQILYPTSLKPAANTYKINWQYQNYKKDYVRMQTMTDYTGDTGENATLVIPDGVQYVDMDAGMSWSDRTIRIFQKMVIPDSVLCITEDEIDDLIKGLDITEEYEVSENNAVYSSYKGMLFNKQQTEIYDIPYNVETVEVPDGVEKIHFRYYNNITDIYFTSEKPGDYDFSWLIGARIHVPAGSYLKYLAAWGKNPGDSIVPNVLVADGEDIEDFTEDTNGIYSPDGKILKSAKRDVAGTYVVPEGVEKIEEGALDNCGTIDLLILPKSLRTLEGNSLSGNPPTKIVFLGDEAPTIEENTFAPSSILQVHKNVKNSYESAWKQIMGEQMPAVHYRDFTYKERGIGGFEYLDEGTCEDGVCEEGVILIKAPADLTVFNEKTIDGLSCKEIASRAFSGCDKLVMADLPSTIKKIGREAFSGCSKLEGVISESTDSISVGKNAFYTDYNLRWIAWNAKQIDNAGHGYYGQQFAVRESNGADYDMNCYSPAYYTVSEAGGYLLYGIAVDGNGNATKDLYLVGATTSIAGETTLEENTMEITNGVFSNCGNAFTITNLDQIGYIDGSAFSNSGLSGEIRLSDALQWVGAYAFYGCSNITKMVIDGSQLQGSVLEYSCFRNCTNLTSVEFVGTGHYNLGSNAFSECSKLETVYFEEDAGIAGIGTEAFTQTAIKELIIPKNIENIGNLIVAGCPDFEKLIFTSSTPPLLVRYTIGISYLFSDGDEDGLMNGKIVVPEEYKQDYINEWKYYVIGYTKDEVKDAGVTESQILAGENIVRAYLGMDPVADQTTNEPAGATTQSAKETAVQVEKDSTDTSTMEIVTTEHTEVTTEVEATKEENTETTETVTTQDNTDISNTEQSTEKEDTEEQP